MELSIEKADELEKIGDVHNLDLASARHPDGVRSSNGNLSMRSTACGVPTYISESLGRGQQSVQHGAVARGGPAIQRHGGRGCLERLRPCRHRGRVTHSGAAGLLMVTPELTCRIRAGRAAILSDLCISAE